MNKNDAWTLPWDREVLERLEAAQKTTSDAFKNRDRGRDLHPGTDIANHWPFITGCYSGVEQSFKATIANHKGLTVEQLLEEDPRKYKNHHLGRLFSWMDEEAKEALNEYYERFQSLHNYIAVSKLQMFLDEISGGPEGKGYERWRYALVDTESKIPRNSVDCMLAIWEATVKVLQLRVNLVKSQSIVMPDQELCRAIYVNFGNMHCEDITALRTLYENNELSAVARLLWNDHRGICREADDSDRLSLFLRRKLNAIKCKSDNANVARFITRAVGKDASGLSVRWNAERKRFEDVPWNLPERFADSVPTGAQKYSPKDYDDLLRKIYQEGFDVRENLGRVPDDPKWCCVLEAKRQEDEMRVLRLWAQKYAPYHYVEMEGSDSWKATSVRTWLSDGLELVQVGNREFEIVRKPI